MPLLFCPTRRQKNFAKNPEKLGTGEPAGVIASEAANNGLTGGALIPLLSLGIPGDSTTAVLIGAFTLQGIQVGPLFIGDNLDTWYTMMVALLIANIAMFLIMFFAIKYIAKVITVPKYILYPIIIMMCVVGAYAINYGIMFDVWTLLIFGVFGYICSKIGIEVAPLIIGFILGKSAVSLLCKNLGIFRHPDHLLHQKSDCHVPVGTDFYLSGVFNLPDDQSTQSQNRRYQR